MVVTASRPPATESSRLASRLVEVLAIVVTRNGRAWLKDSLVALNTQSYPLIDVVVVDDCSDEDDDAPPLRRVAKRHLARRRHTTLRTPRTLGFGAAINWALSQTTTDAELLLLVHDDACLEPNSVEAMVERMYRGPENPSREGGRTAIVGPKLVAWDDPGRLEEVGLGADRFGYPYSGLEEGERDFGQRDDSREVFHVSSTCMLIRHEVFRRLRGWDASMRAYGEDLDLCWRTHLAGWSVLVEPRATARHAAALATESRNSPFSSVRYLTRRNRMRAVLKNASLPRLLYLIPMFVVLSLTEIAGFLVVGQPGEAAAILKALGWNLIALPSTVYARARAQSARRIPDRRLKRLTVPTSIRVRAYVAQESQRVEEAARRRARLGLLGGRAGDASRRVAGRRGLAFVVAVVLAAAALRGFLLAPQTTVGELLPYPDGATALWRAWAAPWQSSGLGAPGPGPPGVAILGIFSALAFGSAALAQKLLIVLLGLVAGAGAYRLVAPVVDRPGRYAAALAYIAGPLGAAGLRTGSLGALVFGAAAPFVLRAVLGLTGWMALAGSSRTRSVATVLLGSAVSAAFVPGSLAVYAAAALIAGGANAMLPYRARGAVARDGARRSDDALGARRIVRGLLAATAAIVGGWALLLPWSWTWPSGDGALAELVGDDTWRGYAASFRGHGAESVLTGVTPGGSRFFGYALVALGVVAVVVCRAGRRRFALLLWALLGCTGVWVAATSSGLLRPVVASPIEAGVIAALAWAGLAGVAVGGARIDLAARRLGAGHLLAGAGLLAAAALAVAGLAPGIWGGSWSPTAPLGAAPGVVEEAASIMEGGITKSGAVRSLWVGEAWLSALRTPARPYSPHLLTGVGGPAVSDLFAPGAAGDDGLARVVASIELGSTDAGGELLGPYNVRYVVLDSQSASEQWLEQLDLALVRTEPGFLLFENTAVLPRAGLYAGLPRPVGILSGTRGPAPLDKGGPAAPLAQQGRARYGIEDPGAATAAYLAELPHPGWRATAAGAPLERIDGGPGTAFALPPGAAGPIEVTYASSGVRRALPFLLAFAWFVAAITAVAGGGHSGRHGAGGTSARAAARGERA